MAHPVSFWGRWVDRVVSLYPEEWGERALNFLEGRGFFKTLFALANLVRLPEYFRIFSSEASLQDRSIEVLKTCFFAAECALLAVLIREYAQKAYDFDPNRRLPHRSADDRWSGFHLAVNEGRMTRARWLIHRGADIELPTDSPDSQTPLCLAAGSGSTEMVELLLERGVDLEKEGNRCAFHEAVKSENLVAADLLLEWGAPIDAVDRVGRTALHWAALSGDSLYSFQRLVEWGASLEIEDEEGKTPLQLAWETNRFPAVRFLRGILKQRALEKGFRPLQILPEVLEDVVCDYLWHTAPSSV